MKHLFISFIFLALSTLDAGQTAQMVKDAQSMQKVLDDMSKAWDMHNAKEFSMLFSEDADFTNVRGMSAHGRTDIEKFHEKPFATWFKNSNLKITDKKIRFITADISSVDAWWEMTGAQTPDGKDIPLRKGLLNFIMTRGDDQWLIMVMHNMDLPLPQQ
jgi:uncharacterized protein (TIGR02246 family)